MEETRGSKGRGSAAAPGPVQARRSLAGTPPRARLQFLPHGARMGWPPASGRSTTWQPLPTTPVRHAPSVRAPSRSSRALGRSGRSGPFGSGPHRVPHLARIVPGHAFACPHPIRNEERRLHHVPAVLRLNPRVADAFAALDDPTLVPARVAREDRDRYLLSTEAGECPAVLAGRLRHEARHRSDLPAVGDWVAARVSARLRSRDRRGAPARERVHACASRRARRGTGGGRQRGHRVRDGRARRRFQSRRIERYLAATWESGAIPVVVLNKSDLAEDPGSRRRGGIGGARRARGSRSARSSASARRARAVARTRGDGGAARLVRAWASPRS